MVMLLTGNTQPYGPPGNVTALPGVAIRAYT